MTLALICYSFAPSLSAQTVSRFGTASQAQLGTPTANSQNTWGERVLIGPLPRNTMRRQVVRTNAATARQLASPHQPVHAWSKNPTRVGQEPRETRPRATPEPPQHRPNWQPTRSSKNPQQRLVRPASAEEELDLVQIGIDDESIFEELQLDEQTRNSGNFENLPVPAQINLDATPNHSPVKKSTQTDPPPSLPPSALEPPAATPRTDSILRVPNEQVKSADVPIPEPIDDPVRPTDATLNRIQSRSETHADVSPEESFAPEPHFGDSTDLNAPHESPSSQSPSPVPPKPIAPPAEQRLAPPTVVDFHQPYLWHIELGEAIYLGLNNSPAIKVQAWVPRLSETKIEQEFGRFDPTIDINHHFAGDSSRIASTIDTFGTNSNRQERDLYGSQTGNPDQLAISRTLPSGASVRAGYSAGYSNVSPVGSFATLNPAWRSSTSLQLTQPLQRGRGRDIQTMPIRIAQAVYQSTEHSFQGRILKLVRDIEMAYWGLVFAHKNLEVRRQDTVEARKTYEKQQEKLIQGESSRPEIGEARLHYYRNVVLYQQRKSELLEVERQFRQLLGIASYDERRIFVELPTEPPEFHADWDESLAIVLENRPELIAQRELMESTRLHYLQTANLCLPDLNLEARLGRGGLDDRFSGAFERMVNGDDLSWLLGISYQRSVNNHQIRAEVRRAHFEYERQKDVMEQLRQSTLHDLQRSFAALHQRADAVQSQKAVREAAAERLASYEEKFNLGELEIELYLRAQAANSDAALQEHLANVKLRQAIADFEYVRGTLLDQRMVVIQDQSPKLTASENREGDLRSLPEVDVSKSGISAPKFEELIDDLPERVKESFQRNKDLLKDPLPQRVRESE